VESTSSFEGMPTVLPLLQSHLKTLSKLICSPAYKNNFMKTPSNFAKNIFSFQPPLRQLYENPRALKECQRAANYIEPTQIL
jgi:hypothetical protein